MAAATSAGHPLSTGYRVFRFVNRYLSGPALKAGLGTFMATSATGSMLVLRTIGRASGRVRETPVNYTVVDGRYVLLAGRGRSADWLRNALAHPDVEVVVNGTVLRGRAVEITDPDERRRAFRAGVEAMPLVARLTVGDLGRLTPDRIDELVAATPVLAITPTAVVAGPFDPGGSIARLNTVVQLGGPLLLVVLGVRRALRRSRRP